jgi:hypothetical protein
MLAWKYRRKITIDSSKVDSALEHFPVLLKLGSSVGIGDDDLICSFDFGEGKEVSSGTFTIQWHTDGIITLATAA